ncbi:MAG: hypothetical protein WDN49_03775 [Acetobacteraceae bacterium]
MLDADRNLKLGSFGDGVVDRAIDDRLVVGAVVQAPATREFGVKLSLDCPNLR